jgi:hypothetical protein
MDGATDGARSRGSVAAPRTRIGGVKRLLALLLGGLGLRALLRRRTPAALGPSPADDLRAKLDQTRVEAEAVPEPASEPEAEPSVGDRRTDVHAKARAAIDELKED